MNGLPPHHPDQYRVLRFVARNDRAVLVALGIFVVGLCLYLFWRTEHPEWLVAAVVFGVAAMAVGKLVLELVKLIAEMLLPR
jgi:uncharacterized protein (DUF983 family)